MIDDEKRDQVVHEINMTFKSFLQQLGYALSDDGKIDYGEAAGIAAYTAPMAFNLARSARGLNNEDWGEILAEWSSRAGL